MKIQLAGMILAAAVTAVPAAAATVNVTITGQVGSNAGDAVDDGSTNFFGGSLTPGAAFTASFVYDTTVGSRGTMVNSLPADVLSGQVAGVSNPAGLGNPISATLTIGGATRAVASNPASPDIRDNGSVFVQPSANPSGLGQNYDWAVYQANAESYTGTQSDIQTFRMDVFGILGSIPSLLTTNYSISAPISNFGLVFPYIWGTFSASSYDSVTGASTVNTFAALFGDRIDVTCVIGCGTGGGGGGGGGENPPPVPLPASGLLLLGAGAGLAAFRRKARRAA